MKYRPFGGTGLSTSVLGFGAASISGEGAGYGFGDISEDKAIELCQYAYNLGVNIFDTAPCYGYGSSEIRLGKAFKQLREKVYIVSKSGVDWHNNKRINITNEPVVTKRMLHESLKRLDTEYIDLFMVHWPDKNVDIRHTVEVLAKAQYEKKIHFIGLCNTNIAEIELASEIVKVDAIQSEFNLFNQSVKKELFEKIKQDQLAFMSWGTLDKGILSGSVTKERDDKGQYDESDARRRAPWWKNKGTKTKIDKFFKFSESLPENISARALAIQHNLSYSEVATCLCGGRSLKQWDELSAAVDEKIPISIIESAKEELRIG